MPSTMRELCQKLSLSEEFRSEGSLLKLKQWCGRYISKDMHFDGSSEEQYLSYYEYVRVYFEFLAQLPQDLSHVVSALDNLNPIQYASSKGYTYFLEKNLTPILVNTASIYAMTPLHFAASSGCFHTVEILLEKGGDPLMLNLQEEPALFRALFLPLIYRADCVEQKKLIFKLLTIISPETVTFKAVDGDNIVHRLVVHRVFFDLMDYIVNTHPGLVFEQNNYGLYPIHMAILNHALEAVEYLMGISGMTELKDTEERTPLHFAARSNQAIMIEVCFNANPRLINVQDSLGKTPLLLAAELNNIEAVTTLLRLGADAQAKDMNGLGIGDYAKNFNYPELQELIKKNGLISNGINVIK
jgi:ankyrin repeat protein